MPSYMFDTNIFNRIVEGKITPSAIAGRDVFAMHVQWDELNNTRRINRREELCAAFRQVAPTQLSTNGACWNISKWNMAEWGGSGLLEKMRPVLEKLDKKSKTPFNQSRDLLIAATAINKAMILVTDDDNLKVVAAQFGGTVIDSAEFVRIASPIRPSTGRNGESEAPAD